MTRFDWRGCSALVTGASSGIGEALALGLARGGARVGLVARREDALRRVADAIHSAGGEAICFPCDLSDAAATTALANDALRDLGEIDLLVNNAGFGGYRRLVEWQMDDIERMTRVNYLAAVSLTRSLLPPMLERRHGALVFVSSVAGKIATPLEAPYAASKAALLAFAESVSLEVEEAGVHVLSVCPGVIETAFFSQEHWARMPAVARRGSVPVDGLVRRVLQALSRGRPEVTHPASIALAYRVKALAPSFMRSQLKRTTLGKPRGR